MKPFSAVGIEVSPEEDLAASNSRLSVIAARITLSVSSSNRVENELTWLR